VKLTYIGKQQPLTPPQERKLEARLAKLSKMLDRRGQTTATAGLSVERHLHLTEITVHFYGQALVGSGANTDQFNSLMDAIENIETQIKRFRSKRRDARRDTPQRAARTTGTPPPEPVLPPVKEKPVKARLAKIAQGKPDKVVRAGGRGNGKPMTVEEAMLTMEKEQDYVVYRDSETDKVSVLVRRRDGKLDLIEA
jgi:putative sigma-54 modulation protein